jgi:hypothetical protein
VVAYDVETWRRQAEVVGWAARVLIRSAEAVATVDFDDMIWLPTLHDVPFPAVDLLFIDEAQDLNPVQHALVTRMNPGGRTIVVGDPLQCQPAGTMVSLTGGGRKPIEDIREGDEVVSFDRHSTCMVGRERRGRKVTATSSRFYSGDILNVGAGNKTTECTPEHKWVTRFTRRDVNLWVTYLMKKGDRYRVGWCQLFSAQGSSHLAQRARHERADAAWILAVHRTKAEASIAENVAATIFGLPTILFHPINNNLLYTEENIDKFYEQMSRVDDMRDRVERCLRSFGRSIDHPFYTAGSLQKQGSSSVFVTQACNLIPKIMAIPVYQGEKEPTWLPIEGEMGLSRVPSRRTGGTTVYSLQVEGNETYVADGLVTHNSIYAFRGADSESMAKLERQLEADVLPLTVSFRCPRSHVELVQGMVADFEAAPDAPDGTLARTGPESIEGAGPGDLVLCRANAPLVSNCLRLIRDRRRAVVRGRAIGDQLNAIARKIEADTVPEMIRGIRKWYAKEVERLERKDGTEHLMEAALDKALSLEAIADSCSSPAEVPGVVSDLFADDDPGQCVTFSTVHRAKGSEARDVRYIQVPYSEKRDAFRQPQQWELDQRRNLRYVALTRSLDSLILITPDRKGA